MMLGTELPASWIGRLNAATRQIAWAMRLSKGTAPPPPERKETALRASRSDVHASLGGALPFERRLDTDKYCDAT